MKHSFTNIDQATKQEKITVFLPGWGFDGSIFRLLKPAPPWISTKCLLDPETFHKDFLHLIESENLNKIRIIGWSLGAMLGLDFTARYPEKVESLVLVAMRSSWPEHEIIKLQSEFTANRENFLKNFYRKCFLGDKESYRNFCTNLEPLYLSRAGVNTAVLQRGLDFLKNFSPPDQVQGVSVHLMHGRQDIVAPVNEMATIKDSKFEIIENSGHAAFLSENCSLQKELRKHAIKLKFSRAAESYDSYAEIQADVARKLAAKLPVIKDTNEIKSILEIGCGTGNFTSMLADSSPATQITAIDFSPQMIAKAEHKLQKETIKFVCAEGEEFLEKAGSASFDLVASNGSLQWFSDHDQALKNIARILLPGGTFLCSIFGPDSLKKLGLGMKTLFGYPGNVAANAFPDLNTLQNSLDTYFTRGTIEQELIEKQYDSVHDLLVHIKKTGTGGWHQHGSPTLTKVRMKQLDNWFVKTYGSCTVNYQVHFLMAIK